MIMTTKMLKFTMYTQLQCVPQFFLPLFKTGKQTVTKWSQVYPGKMQQKWLSYLFLGLCKLLYAYSKIK